MTPCMIPSSLVFSLGAGLGAMPMNQEVAVIGGSGAFAYSRPHVAIRRQNQTLLQIIHEIDRMQAGKRLTPDDRSAEMLREARAGGMYGIGPCE